MLRSLFLDQIIVCSLYRYMMDFRPSYLLYIMSNPTNYYQLLVLLLKTTRSSRNRKNLNFDAKIGALQVEKNRSKNFPFKCKLHHMVPAKTKSAFFSNFGFISSPPIYVCICTVYTAILKKSHNMHSSMIVIFQQKRRVNYVVQ